MAWRCSRRVQEATIISAEEVRARPDLRFMLRHPAHLLALGAGAGLVPGAPGTAGTLLAFPVYWGLASFCTAQTLLVLITVGFVVGVWACGCTGRALGVSDHGGIVWDEIIAFMLVLVFIAPAGYLWQGAAFLLFRLFDILKPPPIRYYDRKLKNGFGVMFDDLLAAAYTLLVLAVFKQIFR